MEYLYALWRFFPAPLLVYQIAVTVIAAFMLINAALDWFYFRRPRSVSAPKDIASVSVLIPARNEEAHIGACIDSLLAQDYPGPLEIIVLDDRSEDGTSAEVQKRQRQAHASRPTLKLMQGGEILPGWKGKPNALRQMATEASGELLLLTDADCVFLPGAIAAAVAFKEETKADSLSLIPFLQCDSFWENVLIPLQYFLIFATLPVRAISETANPAFAASNGAFILISARTYAALGGHSAVRDEMAEDVLFARHVKRSGYRLFYGDGAAVYKVRMYASFQEIWAGFSKNLFSAMGKSVPIVLLWSVFALATQVAPFAFLTVALIRGDHSLAGFALPLMQCLVALGIRAALAVRFQNALWATLTHPLGWFVFTGIALRSAYLGISGKGHAWKGRVYQ